VINYKEIGAIMRIDKHHAILKINILFLLFFIPNYSFTQQIGINLNSINYYSTAWTFVDCMKSSGMWISFGVNNSEWDSGYKVPVNDQGYPLEIPYDLEGTIPPQAVHIKAIAGNFPEGMYTLIFEGTGKIKLSAGYNGIYTTPNIPHHFYIGTESVILSIEESISTDPIRNIRLITPGFEESYETQIFHPLFLERLSGFSYLRFMDWGNTNGNKVTTWEDVTPRDYYTQAKSSGVSIEYMLALSNKLNVDPWICIPHLADDNYVKKIAQLINNTLNIGKKVYIEYGNEAWNNIFAISEYVRNKGLEAGLSQNENTAGYYWYARRSAEIFKIFENEIDNSHYRLVKVASGKASSTTATKSILEGFYNNNINTTNIFPDVFAIAPYFGGSIADDIGDNSEIYTITITEILNRLKASINSNTATWTSKVNEIVKTYGLPLISYEGGPHLVANQHYRENETLTNKLMNSNRDPRMKDIYISMYNSWISNGGGIFTVFSNVAGWSKYGSWGILEYQDQPIGNAPKYTAIRQLLFSGDSSGVLVKPPINVRIK